MRKLIVLEYITLDGVIQAAGGSSQEDTLSGFKHGGWQLDSNSLETRLGR